MLVITFQNKSKLAPLSDYDYEVWVTATNGQKKVLAAGEIKQHGRAAGWKVLVQTMLTESGPDT